MPPKPPWNKKATTSLKHAQSNTSVEPAGAAAIKCAEAQAEEIDVLRAIYMDDYDEVEIRTAWSTTTDRMFKLRLRSFSNQDAFVVLSVHLTASYPKTVPLLDAQGLDDYHERTQRRIRNIVNHRPKLLLGEVMIHTLANEIQEALEDAVLARQQNALPSLEEERASAEEVALAFAKQAQENEARRQQEAQEEEDRVLKQMVNDEISRRDKRRPTKLVREESVQVEDSSLTDMVSFDQPASLRIANEHFCFDKVTMVSVLSRSRDQQTFLAKPHVHDINASRLVVVRRITFQKNLNDILELESELTSILKLRHPGLLSTLAYRIDKVDNLRSELILCEEHADRGSLQDMLEISSINVNKARQFTIELLEALEYLHHRGVAHGQLTARNVGVVSSPSTTLKLAEFGYSWRLPGREGHAPRWPPPESDTSAMTLRESDLWQFGEVISQMFLRVSIASKYGSPQLMLARMNLSESFDDFLGKIFASEAKKRSSVFDLLTAEFLRTDDPVMENTHPTPPKSVRDGVRVSSSMGTSPAKRRSRHNSSSLLEPVSRYAHDFAELGRLGKGGFGEVVKARGRLDGGVYAIKKIKSAGQLLDQVVSEVMLLNRLNHPYVVRYFSTWIEDDTSGSTFDGSSTETETGTQTQTDDDGSDIFQVDFGYASGGGLDFISSGGFPQVEFGNDSDDESSNEGALDEEALEDSETDSQSAKSRHGKDFARRKSRSDSKKAPSTLFIQMEFAERSTLRDLVRKQMTVDESWQFVRQITEGLAHIHGHGIIHRDLKPDNIFIDMAGNPKIGDFGLATTAQQHLAERATTMSSGRSAGEMTRSVGTTLYVAPELRTTSGVSYSNKVDIYSLGIIFYEMCEPFSTGMERVNALQRVREKEHELPPAYQPYGAKAAQGRLISSLISHKPSERPSSTELLRSDMIPLKIEDESIRKALSGLADSRSPYHQKVMSALFAHDTASESRVKALAWDARTPVAGEGSQKLRLRSVARQTLVSIFQRHGAEEIRRQGLFPKSDYYTNASLVQVLDASGNLLQMPFDLVLPHARQLSRQNADVRCTFSFGSAYRDAFDGGPPRTNDEVDFDITNNDNGENHVFNDAEVIKVMDEIACEMPLFATSTTTTFHLNHSSVLGAVLALCRIPSAQRLAVKEIISRLGFNQYTWSKVRADLRRFGLPDTTLDELHQFDFRDSPEKAFARLKTRFASAGPQPRGMLDEGIKSLQRTISVLSLLNVRRRIYIAPLASVNAKFYEEGILFQCVLEKKSSRVVIAAGGRYDSLIRAHCQLDARTKNQGCVGVSIGLDAIIGNMARANDGTSKKTFLKDPASSESTPKRCDVLVAANGSEEIESTGMKVLTMLWENDISAELSNNQIARGNEHNFHVAVKHEASSTVKFTNLNSESEEVDVPVSALVAHLQQELHELESKRPRQRTLVRQASQQEPQQKSNVHVLLARYGSKKSNKYQIVGDAQEQWSRKLEAAKNGPILAVETRDEVLDLVQQTRLSDAESWRKAVQSVQLNDRQYVQQIHDMLASWRAVWEGEAGVQEACVFNFRTQRCMYYDLGL